MITINRIGVGTAFKVAAVFSALMWAVIGLLYMLFFFLIVSSTSSTQIVTSTGTSTVDMGEFAGASGALFIFFYLCGVPFYAVMGGISGAIAAVMYNFVARTVGGLEFEVTGSLGNPYDDPFTPVGKRKTIDIPGRDY